MQKQENKDIGIRNNTANHQTTRSPTKTGSEIMFSETDCAPVPTIVLL